MRPHLRNYFFMFSGIMVLTGSVCYITHWFYSPYLFAFGAAGIALCFMTEPYQNLAFRQRRLHRINIFAGISLIASSVFMFRRKMEWVVFLLIAALLFLYTSFISPRTDK